MALILFAACSAFAQQALQNSLAGDAAARLRSQQMQSQDYSFKKGDFRMLLLPSLGFEWNDNVNLSQTNVMNDFIVRPALGITASYPLSQRNLLFLDLTLGYDYYLNHQKFSTFNLNSSSGTGLSFDIAIKDFTINLHDWMSYVQDSARNGTVANTANYGAFQNTAGLSGRWDLNQANLSVGYDHQNIMATSSQFNDINHESEMFFARAGLDVHPKVTVGVESSASFTTYEKNALNDNDAYTVGPYVEFRPGKFFRIAVRGGYSTYQFENTSSLIQTASRDSWYGGMTISHQPSEVLTYSLDVGRETQFGVGSDLVEDWYVRPNIHWKIIKGLDIVTSGFYQHGKQGVGSTGSLPGYSKETFDWYGGSLALQHAITSRLTVGLNYRITLRSSSAPNDGYTQNVVGLQVTYHPK